MLENPTHTTLGLAARRNIAGSFADMACSLGSVEARHEHTTALAVSGIM